MLEKILSLLPPLFSFFSNHFLSILVWKRNVEKERGRKRKGKKRKQGKEMKKRERKERYQRASFL
jgi:hypothetical protein